MSSRKQQSPSTFKSTFSRVLGGNRKKQAEADTMSDCSTLLEFEVNDDDTATLREPEATYQPPPVPSRYELDPSRSTRGTQMLSPEDRAWDSSRKSSHATNGTSFWNMTSSSKKVRGSKLESGMVMQAQMLDPEDRAWM